MLRKIKGNRLFREDWKCRWRLTGCQYKPAPEYRHSNHSMQSATKLLYVFLLLLLSLSGAEWTVTPNTDCSPGQGGEAIGQDSDTTSISLSKCLTACEEDDTCVAVVRQANDEAGFCHMRFSKATASSIFQLFLNVRSKINLVLCVADKGLDVHTLNRGQDGKPSLITITDSGSVEFNWFSAIINSFAQFFAQSGK